MKCWWVQLFRTGGQLIYILFQPKRECEGLIPRMQQFFFKTNGCSSLHIHLRWKVQLFWTAFDMPVIGVPLKVALGYKKIVFLGVSKNNHEVTPVLHLGDFAF